MSDKKYSMKCIIVTPENKILDSEVTEIVLPLHDGLAGILPGHAPLLARLKPSVMRYKDLEWDEYIMFVDGGFAHIRNNEIIILTPNVYKPAQVEFVTARDELEKAFALPSITPDQVEKRMHAIERARQIMAFSEIHSR